MCRVPAASSSRLSTRYAAKNTTSSTLAASPGWKLSGPTRTQRRAPLISWPMPGQRREQQRGDAEQQERVLVALERADVAHDDRA